MTNREKYAEQIIDMALDSIEIAVDKEGKSDSCHAWQKHRKSVRQNSRKSDSAAVRAECTRNVQLTYYGAERQPCYGKTVPYQKADTERMRTSDGSI